MSETRVGIAAEDVEQWFEQESETEPGERLHDADQTDPGKKYAISQLRVVRETKDYQLDYLRHALQPGKELIDTAPAYQRRLRWSNKKKSLLIESFLLNIPVPPIFLFERDYNEYEVIDGRQRLEAISAFLGDEYALSGLEYWPELNRLRFSKLPKVLQKGLLRRSLPAVVLLAETKETAEDGLDVRRVLFDRLNTGGTRLNPQELRNALYPGTFNALLIKLARSAAFTETWGIPPQVAGEEREPTEELLRNPLYSSLADAELVLRFFALRNAIVTGKQGSLRSILDSYMEKHAMLDDNESQAMEEQFITCLSRLRAVFGDMTFRLTSKRLSRPLYDALMIALSRNPDIDIENRADSIRAALKSALDDEAKYDVLVGRGNTINAIHERVELADEILHARG
ncbi:DUF262 domain-containing protein [Saccharothrix sp. NPDC042600]|uniref:DUF262 domain-containing protein n=1 Tax=Saccharothrix TaxID=2071 RepID=UPI0033D2A68E